jgi:adenylate kinase
MRKIILLIGAPGSGKGSRCEECKKAGYIQISSSKLIEEAGYDLSRGGAGISDEVVLKLIMNKIKSLSKNSKIILDGFPRRLKQAELLNKYLKIDQVIYLKITENVALERVKNRIICPKCKISYSQSYKPPIKEGICDKCGRQLIHKASDTEEIFFKRFKVFNENAYPVLEYYNNNGICIKTVNAETDFDIISIIKNNDA